MGIDPIAEQRLADFRADILRLERREPADEIGDERAEIFESYPRLAAIATEDVLIAGSNGSIAARRYFAEGVSRGCLVWAHGGSFIGGNLEQPEADWVSLALAHRGFSVLSVDYTKALNGVHFPVPSLDLLEALQWATANLRSDRVHLGGASAGANLAAGVALRARDGQAQPPASLILVYPLLHAKTPPAGEEARLAAGSLDAELRFPPAMIEAMARNYAGTETNLSNGYAFAGAADLTGLPPTFVLNSERDDLRASGETFAAKAQAAGVTVLLECEPSTTHGHLNMWRSAAAQKSIGRIERWLGSV